MDRGISKPRVVETQCHDCAPAAGRKTQRKIGFELADELGDPLFAPARVADREFDFDDAAARSILVDDFDRIRIGADRAVAQQRRVTRIFRNLHERAQSVDARIGGDFVRIVVRRQFTLQQRHCHRVLQAVITVGRVAQSTRLVDLVESLNVHVDLDRRNIVQPLMHGRMEPHRALDRGLRMYHHRAQQFEQDAFHYRRPIRTGGEFAPAEK